MRDSSGLAPLLVIVSPNDRMHAMRYYLCADKADPNKNAWTPDIAAAQLFRTKQQADNFRHSGPVEGATGIEQGQLIWYVVRHGVD